MWSGGGRERDPGLVLGAALGEAALRGRDKVTFVMSPAIATFADWLEQLLAESTGKEGKGLIPVAGEALRDPAGYRLDRLFVQIKLASEADVVAEAASKPSRLPGIR